KTKFPDELSKNLTVGYNLMRMRDMQGTEKEKGCDMIIEAFKQCPYQITAIELVRIASYFPQFRDKVTEVLSNYFDDFAENEQQYKEQNGYHQRIISAIMAGNYLANINGAKPELAKEYKAKTDEFISEQRQIGTRSRW
ncbi:MAG: hypothetical protein PHP01_06605, partial [Phycisphaerae bacterium]|nr:hypothetical protein [Phycisphaerae bacterium]